MTIKTYPRAGRNQLDLLCEQMAEHPDLAPLMLTAEQIEALFHRDGWSMMQMFPTSASNPQNPTLRVTGNSFPVAINSWGPRLEQHRGQIERVIPYVGRLETTRAGVEKVEGTGWLVRSDVVVTNRHVANEIGPSIANAEARLRIDFEEENGVNIDPPLGAQERRREFTVLEVLYTAEEDSLDLAFLRIAPGSASARAVIELGDDPSVGLDVCAIGYPALRDSIYTPSYFSAMFGEILGVKRLSPGKILAFEPDKVSHDCATVGGSSGSVIVEMVSGKAVALNFAEDGPVNYGVPASIVRERLAKI